MIAYHTITEAEHRSIESYRKADGRAQRSIGEYAEDWPAPRPRPLLALVPIEREAVTHAAG